MATVGTLLKMIRAKKNLSQGELADFLGITQNFLSQVENDKKTMSLTKIEDISKKLGFSKEIFMIACSDIPSELNEKEKVDFEKMQHHMIKYILSKA